MNKSTTYAAYARRTKAANAVRQRVVTLKPCTQVTKKKTEYKGNETHTKTIFSLWGKNPWQFGVGVGGEGGVGGVWQEGWAEGVWRLRLGARSGQRVGRPFFFFFFFLWRPSAKRGGTPAYECLLAAGRWRLL